MDFSQLKELLSLVDQSTLRDFNLQMDNISVQMSKNDTVSSAKKTDTSGYEKNNVANEIKRTTDLTNSVLKKEDEKNNPMNSSPKEKEGELVRSPIVGIAYLSPSPEKPAYKKIGDQIAIGETLCIIEAMKVMNEVKSELTGEITEILVEDGAIVEYDQPLFRIKG